MKLFKISATGYGPEDYISVIVLARDATRAIILAKKGLAFDWRDPKNQKVYWEFKPEQYPLIAEEIDLNKEQVVVSECFCC